MTNEVIILNERVKLMKDGALKSTGNYITVEDKDGNKIKMEEPEEIHTFNGWKERGYSVRKGEKSKIKYPIWKYTEKKKEENEKTGNPLEDAPITNMFLKMSAFFTAEQVEAIKE